MSAGSCQAHSLGLLSLEMTARVTPVWPQRREVGKRSSRGVFHWQWQGHSPGHGPCWRISLGRGSPGCPTWFHLGLGSPKFFCPSGSGSEESGWEMELRVPQSRLWNFGSFHGPDPMRFFLWFWFFCSSQALGECYDTRLQLSAAAAQKCWLITGLLARGLRQTWNH